MYKFLYVLLFIILFTNSGWASDVIIVYSGAGMRRPMDKIGVAFKKKYGIYVRYNYGGSNSLLSQIALTKKGDCYMPGATYYIKVAERKGFIDYKQLVAYHIPVIIVPKGNHANITRLSDLTRPGVKIVFADPKVAAIGRLTNKILKKNNIKKSAVWKNVVATTATMNELIVYITTGVADAAINWGDVVQHVKGIQIIKIPREQNIIKVIPIGRLTFSKHKKMAKMFVDFVASSEGKNIFKECGFVVYPDPMYKR